MGRPTLLDNPSIIPIMGYLSTKSTYMAIKSSVDLCDPVIISYRFLSYEEKIPEYGTDQMTYCLAINKIYFTIYHFFFISASQKFFQDFVRNHLTTSLHEWWCSVILLSSEQAERNSSYCLVYRTLDLHFWKFTAAVIYMIAEGKFIAYTVDSSEK